MLAKGRWDLAWLLKG